VQDKEGFRMIMKRKLNDATTDEQREQIIEKYKKMFE
jgi:hypothetical protein